MIAVLDYGSGNVRAFLNAYERMKVPCRAARRPEDLAGAERIILPGVGAFDTALRQFEASGMRDPVERKVLGEGMPLLGICVGMQMLAKDSAEGTRAGLGWVPGHVRRLGTGGGPGVRLPHMGWNRIEAAGSCPVLRELPNGGRFYFLHSYFFDAEGDTEVIARVEYGARFPCAVRRGNIFAVQFHPEKSHEDGMRLLRNFSTLT